MNGHVVSAVAEVKGHIRGVQEIIREVLLDHVLLISGTDDKFVEPIGTVGPHNVYQNWNSTNFNHGFGFELAFFGNSGAEATG